HSGLQNRVSLFVARNFRSFEATAKTALRAGLFSNRVFGKNFMRRFTGGIKKIIPAMPLWTNQLRAPGKKIKSEEFVAGSQHVIYFSTCISRMMGGNLPKEFLSVCQKAKINVIVPKNIKGTCCGQVFSSKGFDNAFRHTANQTIEKLWKYSQEGKIGIVADVTSCTQTMRSYRAYLADEN